ncbi:MAG: tripartite tricarboxylate transporter substrate binding protein [Alphaproteobacteria bacterium]|nr:tripartite tricarboxylate transporter substrate binding protein [Alphaproteobacteria bacterium]
MSDVKSTGDKRRGGLGRRQFLAGAGAVAGAATFTTAGKVAKAATFPSGPVQLVVPFGTGGGSDRAMRLFAPYLAKELGQPVNVINIAGGGGWKAWSQMAQWDPEKDDHIIGTINLPHVLSLLDPRMKRTETLESFNFIAWHSLDPCIWAVREGDERFQSLRAFIDHARANPNKLVMSTTAVGSDDHMGIAFAEKFVDGFKVQKVYANNDGKKIQEVIGGHTDAVGGNVGYYVPYMLDRKLRAICVLSEDRSPNLPTVPTFEEVTGKKNISFAGRTFALANGIAAEKQAVYLKAIKTAMNNPEYALKEAANRNPLVFKEGEELWKALRESEELVKAVKFWELEQ